MTKDRAYLKIPTDPIESTNHESYSDYKLNKEKMLKSNKRSGSQDEKNKHDVKYQRKEHSVINLTAEEIRHIAYSNLHKFSNAQSSDKPSTLQDWMEKCNDVIKNPKPMEIPTMPMKSLNSVTSFDAPFQTIPTFARSYLNPYKITETKLDELYPISKGEIHKISEDKSESELTKLSTFPTETRQFATIVNCPIVNTYGARLLTKMGWRFGEGLGKDKNGIFTAIKFEAKIGRQGLATPVEKIQFKQKKPDVEKNSDKNPVSVLMEYCQKNKLSPAIYTDVEEVGPTNNRQFRISVSILNNTYLSPSFFKTKKEARAASAAIAAKELKLL